MKTQLSIFLLAVVFLAGCSSAIQTPAAEQGLPSPPPALAATQTATGLAATQEAPTDTPQPTETPLPTETVTPTDTAIPTDTPGVIFIEIVDDAPLSPAPQGPVPSQGCQSPPAGWVRYTVRTNDTLSSLGQRTGTSWQKIQAANCLGSTMILAGQTLYLPFIPRAAPAQGNAPAASPASGVEVPIAPNPGNPALHIDPEIGPAGTVFNIKLENFQPGESVVVVIQKLNFEQVYRVDVQTDNTGFGLAAYPSAADAMPMTYRVKAQGATNTLQGQLTITN